MSETVTISTKRFSDLSLEELYGVLRVRSDVFVTGQKCLYVDPDGKDLDSVQVFAYTIGFYEKLGFKFISDEFLDEGIPHKGMELLIDSNNRYARTRP